MHLTASTVLWQVSRLSTGVTSGTAYDVPTPVRRHMWIQQDGALSHNGRRELASRRLFRVPQAAQTSMPSPGFKPRPYCTAINVTNHYTDWRLL
ncbi:hypothetical protein TNCV_871831 [Trichonephila clavipes]|nr:hypothetical protein TNCV_871831 [Trichonephila clavipes]